MAEQVLAILEGHPCRAEAPSEELLMLSGLTVVFGHGAPGIL